MNCSAAHDVRTCKWAVKKKKEKEKETLWVLIAAAVLVATGAADEPDLEVKRFFFVTEPQCLFSLVPAVCL